MAKSMSSHDISFRNALLEWNTFGGEHDLSPFRTWSVEAAIGESIKLLWDEEPTVYNRAVKLLRLLDPRRANELFLEMIVEPKRRPFPLERLYGFLGDYNDSRNLDLLLDVLQFDPNPDHRIAAALGVGKLGNKDHLPLLKNLQRQDEALSSNPWRVESVADVIADAIGEIEMRGR